jgi:hypothetical protein
VAVPHDQVTAGLPLHEAAGLRAYFGESGIFRQIRWKSLAVSSTISKNGLKWSIWKKIFGSIGGS